MVKNYGLLPVNSGLPYGIVDCDLGRHGIPDEHRDLTFLFEGPLSQGFQKPWWVGPSLLIWFAGPDRSGRLWGSGSSSEAYDIRHPISGLIEVRKRSRERQREGKKTFRLLVEARI